MGLVGLPRTKSAVIARAKAEGWRYEEKKDIGGTKRMYELPAKYLQSQAPAPSPAPVLSTPAPVVGTVVSGTNKVDTEKLELAIRALTEWEQERNVQVSPERRPAVIALLYEYLEAHLDEGADAMQRVLRAIG